MKSSGEPILPVTQFVPCRAVIEKLAQEISARSACRFRPADSSRWQCAAHAVHGVIVELEIIRPRTVPVANVRFVPDFPIPLAHFVRAVFFNAMFRPLINQFAPFCIIRWRIGLASADRRHFIDWRVVRIILRMGRERLRHETNFHVRFHAAFEISVENLVVDCPVVNRVAVRVLLVGAGRTPFQRIRAVAAREQMMAADENLRPAKLSKFSKKFPAVLHVSVIRLVIAEETPDWRQLPDRLGGIYGDRNGKGGIGI